MSLNNYLSPRTKVSLKAAFRRMRSMWFEGIKENFDDKLARVLSCSLERAEEIREKWEDLGFLCYDRRGLLCWGSGVF